MAEKRRKITPTKPHFFQPLLPGFQRQLSIPVSFYLKHLKEKNAEKAVLRSPSGKLWHVKMKGRLIEDGWQEFCQHHQFHVGDFLVFRFDDDHHFLFDVLIFDSTTCQRDYSLFIKDEIEETPQEEIPKESAGQSRNKKKGATNLEAKAGFSGSQYPHFVLNLSCYAANHATLSIPKGFAQANGLNERCCKIVLLSEQGKVWVARLGFKQRDGQPYINHRWTAFRYSNSLKAGDSCLFELIRDGEKPVLKITKQTTKKKKKKKKDMTKFEGKGGFLGSQYPYFMLDLSRYAANCSTLYIPKGFARENGLSNRCCKIVLLSEQGKVWVAHLGFKSCDGQPYINHRWTAFRNASSLKAGDSCLFELIRDGEKPVLKITKCPQELKLNLHVRVTVQESYDKSSILRIPNKFARKSGLTTVCPEVMTIRNEKGRSWTVSLWKTKTGVIHIGPGWSTFARSNGIKAGDVLMLGLIRKGKKPVVRISGFKGGGESEKKSSGTRGDIKAVPEIKQEVDAM